MRIGLQTWGSEGDVQPFTALAAGLTRAGHDVTLIVTDNVGRDYSGLAQQFGYSLRAVQNPDSPSPERVDRIWREIIRVGNPIRQAELVMKYGFDPVMEAMFSAAKDLCATHDAVVGHFFVFPLRVAAELAGVPLATVNVVHNCVPSSEICPPGLPDLGRWSYPLGWRLVRTMLNRIFLPRVNALREREGLSPDSDVMTQTWVSERLNLLAVSPSICNAPADWGDNHTVCGFLNPPGLLSGEDPPEGLDEFISTGEPPVYFTFGSMMLHDLDYIREAANIWAATVRQVGCRAVFQLPWDDATAIETDSRVFKVTRAPYRHVFPRCSLVVHHGGAGTTQSSLLSGRPSVVVAHMSDQFFWGSELERLGVAGPTQTRKGLSSRRLARAITRVLECPDMANRASAIGTAMSKENGVDVAVGLIEVRLREPSERLASERKQILPECSAMTKVPRSADPVTVLESADPALLAVAKSLLEAASIQCFAKGEGVQDLFAGGRLGTGFNPFTGPIQLQVAADDAEQAKMLLRDLGEQRNDA